MKKHRSDSWGEKTIEPERLSGKEYNYLGHFREKKYQKEGHNFGFTPMFGAAVMPRPLMNPAFGITPWPSIRPKLPLSPTPTASIPDQILQGPSSLPPKWTPPSTPSPVTEEPMKNKIRSEKPVKPIRVKPNKRGPGMGGLGGIL